MISARLLHGRKRIYSGATGLYAGQSLSYKRAALSKFGFVAPLKANVFLERGSGAASFTRATTATVTDFEGNIRNCLSGEVRFEGQRRVRNGLSASNVPSEDLTSALWTKSATVTVASGVSDPGGGTTAFTLTNSGGTNGDFYVPVALGAGRVIVNSWWVRRRTGTGNIQFVTATGARTTFAITSTWQRYADVATTSVGNPFIGIRIAADGDAIDVWHPMMDDHTGAANQNPSEYVSVGAAKLNYLLETENFASATWSKQTSGTGVAATATNGATAPDGTPTAATVTLNRGAGNTLTDFARFAQNPNPSPASGNWTGGVWVKGTAGEQVAIRGVGSSGYTVLTFSGAWELLSSTEAYASNNFEVTNRGTVTTTNSITFLLWRAQFNQGSSLNTYFPVGNVYPYHGAMVDGVKYFDYQNSNTVASNVVTEGTTRTPCLGYTSGSWTNSAVGYLSEGATTNLVLQSSDFSATWTQVNTPTRSAAAKRVGDVVLDLLGDDNAGLLEYFRQSITFTADASKSLSFLIAQGTATTSGFRLRDDTVAAERLGCFITWSNGVPVATFSTGSQERPPEALGDGVYRIFCLAAGVIAANVNTIQVLPACDSALTAALTGNCYFGGVQAENATVASSLQPTTTATVARNADFLSYPESGNLSAAVGASYIEAGPMIGSGATQVLLGHGDLTGRMVYNVGTPAAMTTYDGTNSVASTSTRAPTQMAKVATTWGGGALKICTDAGVATTFFDGSMGIDGVISVGSAPAGNQMQGLIKNVRIAQVALSNQELVALTA